MIESLRYLFAKLNLDKKGQDLTEYALLVALIAIIVVLAVLFFGEQVSSFFGQMGLTVQSWLDGPS